MIGIKERRLSSSPIQAVIQEDAERAMRVPRVRVERNKIRDGCDSEIKTVRY